MFTQILGFLSTAVLYAKGGVVAFRQAVQLAVLKRMMVRRLILVVRGCSFVDVFSVSMACIQAVVAASNDADFVRVLGLTEGVIFGFDCGASSSSNSLVQGL